jgi:hypothetical protein
MTFPVTIADCARNSLPPQRRPESKLSPWMFIVGLIATVVVAFLIARKSGLLDSQ